MTIGPIQGLVIGFPDNEMFEGRIAEELARLSDVGQIRVIDAVFVTRDGDEIDVLSVSGLDDEQRAELRSAVAALVGLGVAGEEGAVAMAEAGAMVDADAMTVAESVAADLIDELPDGSSALVIAFEHLVGGAFAGCGPRCRWCRPRPSQPVRGRLDRARDADGICSRARGGDWKLSRPTRPEATPKHLPVRSSPEDH